MKNPKTLRLTIKKKWFDMIRSGEKTEEYREIKPHWMSRLDHGNYYQKVEFVNGYKPDSPKVMLECLSISVRKGKPEWGAEPDKYYFVIKLGKILNAEMD